MEHEVSERLMVDSLMTADGEVVQLPTLGPLGPVDADGGRIPLDTKELLDAHGECRKVESYEFSTWSQRWVVHFDSGPGSYADDCHLTPPDSWERLLEDLDEGANHSEYASCFYFWKAECDCSLCKADRFSGCDQHAFKDIASRIRNLRGEVREDA